MKIDHWLLAIAGVLALAPRVQANIIFSQDFTAYPNGPLDRYYYSLTEDPTKWTTISSSGSYASARVANGTLNFSRTGEGAAWFSRKTNFSPAPSAVIYQFDLSVSGQYYQGTPRPAATWQIGSAFDDTKALEPDNVHSQFQLLFTSQAGIFRLRTPAGATSIDQIGGKAITWVVNNSGNQLTYLGPDNLPQTIANDTWDLWAGSSRIFNDVDASSSGSAITDIKLVLNDGFGTVTMDNFRIDDQVSLVPEPATTGALAAGLAFLAIVGQRFRQRRHAGVSPRTL